MTCKPSIKENFVDYLEGTLPIIISAPHGGSDEPSNIKTRTSGVFDSDDYTKELTKQIIEEFFMQTKQYPHTVVMNLARNKVDANRDIYEALEIDDKNAVFAYNSFHKFINNSIDKVKASHKYGLYFDIHGQSHSHKCIELGYLLTNDILKLDKQNLENFKENSSLSTLTNISNKDFIETLNGKDALGTLLQEKGLPTIPSSNNPYAQSDKEYFEGAFNTKNYFQIGKPTITAIQAEFPYYCRESKENRKKVAKAFVTSVLEYFKIHYKVDLRA